MEATHPIPPLGAADSQGQSAALVLALLLALAGLLDLVGCVGARLDPAPPIATTASLAFSEARALLASEASPLEIEEAALRALALEPNWAAPARFLDQRAREVLGEGRALRERLEHLVAAPDDATALYLVGRLEGSEGIARFEKAIEQDPSNPWPRHGLAWMHFLADDASSAWDEGLLACRLARDPYELGHFLKAQARYALGKGEPTDGLEVFEQFLGTDPSRASLNMGTLLPAERAELAAWRAVLELTPSQSEDVADPERAGRGVARALALLEEQPVPEASLLQLVGALTTHIALTESNSLLEELRARLLERGDPAGLRTAILIERRSGGSAAAARMSRAFAGELELDPAGIASHITEEFEAGRFEAALEDWRASQPRFLLDQDGLPTSTRLRRLMESVRTPNGVISHKALGEALLAAGWFSEALSLSIWLRGLDNASALDFEARARRGLAVILAAKEVFLDVDASRRRGAVHYATAGSQAASAELIERPSQASIAAKGRVPSSVEDVLDALAPAFARYFGRAAAEELRSSPRLYFGPFATLVHPGPDFSRADQKSGLGQEGEPVPGLARLMLALGRFCIAGTVRGDGGPDGSILRLLDTRVVAGEHLGVAFRGTVAWCEGQDLESRPGRRGARITGAALHEGYWIDVAAVRAYARIWGELQAHWFASHSPQELRRLVADRGPSAQAAERARTATYAPGRVSDRMRLAIILDRVDAAEQGGSKSSEPWDWASAEPLVSLEDLLQVVARHEEGHLCDRTRFLPLGSHLWKVFRFAARFKFSSAALARQVEARAQLTALCVAEDPRIPLTEVLDALGGGSGVTPHAAAYSELLEDLLELLDRRLDDFPKLDPDYFLLHQLPLLDKEEVRELVLELARREGLVED